MSRQDCVGRRTIGTRARSDESLERRQLVRRAVRKQPRGDLGVAMELRQGVRRGAIGATS